MCSGSIEEYAHYRQHGMCSECKQKNDRRLARRKERLDGVARLEQAWMNGDHVGIEENWHWGRLNSSYDEH